MTTAGAFSPPPVPVRLMTRLPTVSCCQARPRSSAKVLSHLSTLHNHDVQDMYSVIKSYTLQTTQCIPYLFIMLLHRVCTLQQALALVDRRYIFLET